MPAFCRDASLIARPPYTVWLPISTVVIDARLGRAVAAVRFTIYIIYLRPKRAINFPAGDPRSTENTKHLPVHRAEARLSLPLNQPVINVELVVPVNECDLCSRRHSFSMGTQSLGLI